MISHTSDYAIRAVLTLASTPDRPLRADQIAAATGAPRNYLGKTLNSLVKAGVLRSARGPQGGFTLAIPADRLTIARVIDCFVDPRPHTRCLLGNRPCDGTKPCAAHRTWESINNERRLPLARTTVAALLSGNDINNPPQLD
jgi:Rrf2 family protein